MIGGGQCLARRRQELRAGVGDRDMAAGAEAPRGLVCRLRIAWLSGGWGDVQPLRGTTEVQLLGDRDEVRQLGEPDVRGHDWTPGGELTARGGVQDAARIEPRIAVLDGKAPASYRRSQA